MEDSKIVDFIFHTLQIEQNASFSKQTFPYFPTNFFQTGDDHCPTGPLSSGRTRINYQIPNPHIYIF
jgi:hypothetical protein